MSRIDRRIAIRTSEEYLTFVLQGARRMSRSPALTTTVSTKGQVILPKAIRDHRRWPPGTRLIVKETPEGVLLTPASPFPPTRMEDVYGMLKYDGPPVSIEEMDEAVAEHFRRNFGREYDRD
jgi:AbrB family looped-hinge helix DNA binding protein